MSRCLRTQPHSVLWNDNVKGVVGDTTAHAQKRDVCVTSRLHQQQTGCGYPRVSGGRQIVQSTVVGVGGCLIVWVLGYGGLCSLRVSVDHMSLPLTAADPPAPSFLSPRDWEKELHRLGVTSDQWRVTEANKRFLICDRYTIFLIVPVPMFWFHYLCLVSFCLSVPF